MKYSIEDSNDDVFLVREAVAEAGLDYNLTLIQDGGNFAPDLEHTVSRGPLPSRFLVDLNLPKADGLKLLETIRNHPRFAATPVIA